MRLIDADCLVENIQKWQEMLSDEKSIDLLRQFIRCIQAEETVFDVQKLIDGINCQVLTVECFEPEDAKDAIIYNGAVGDVMEEVKGATNPKLKDNFVWNREIKEGMSSKEITEQHHKLNFWQFLGLNGWD